MRRIDKDISYTDNNHTKEQGKTKVRQTVSEWYHEVVRCLSDSKLKKMYSISYLFCLLF